MIRARIKEEYDAEFVFQNTLTDRYNKYIAVTSQRSGQPGVNAQEYAEFEIKIPQKEEQTKIGTYFRNLDTLITLHQRKCDETKKLKKCMLQKMFPKEGEKVPEIRFSGFTGDWKQRKLNEICKINGRIGFRGYTQKDIVSQEQGGVLTFSPTNIVDNTLTMKCRNTYITKEKYEESPEIKIKNGDILFVKTGSTLGKSALVMGLHENATINPQIVVLRTQEEEAKFLSVILISDSLLKKVAAVKIGGAVPTITEAELKNFTFYEPEDFAERVKIGNCFTYFDSIITFHHRKLNILNKICRYAWEQRKLSDIYGSIGNAFVGTATPYYAEQGHFYLESNNVKDGQINHNSEVFINDEFYEKQKDKWLHTGDMVMVQSGHVGHAAVISEELDNTAAHALIMFRNPKEEIEPYFLNYEYQTDKAKKKIDNITTGNTIKHILASDMQEFVVDVPKYEEQKVIADYFRNLDHLITLHQQKCKQLQL